MFFVMACLLALGTLSLYGVISKTLCVILFAVVMIFAVIWGMCLFRELRRGSTKRLTLFIAGKSFLRSGCGLIPMFKCTRWLCCCRYCRKTKLAEGEARKPPGRCMKCCCPACAIGRHQGWDAKCVFTFFAQCCCCGWLYTMLCWKPSETAETGIQQAITRQPRARRMVV